MAPTGFELSLALIQLHRHLRTDPGAETVSRGSPSYIRCLIPAAFVTAFANGEADVVRGSIAHNVRQAPPPDAKVGHPLGLGSKGLVQEYAQTASIGLTARARVAPQVTVSTRIWKWKLLAGTDLSDYLSDATIIRNRMAHTGSPAGAKVRSTWFGRPASITLMAVEGILQAAQDVA